MGPRDRPVTSQRTLLSFSLVLTLTLSLSLSLSLLLPVQSTSPSPHTVRPIFLSTSFFLSKQHAHIHTYARTLVSFPCSIFVALENALSRRSHSLPPPSSSYDPYSNDDAVARTYRGSNCVVGFSRERDPCIRIASLSGERHDTERERPQRPD